MELAHWTNNLAPSFIREILKVTQQPGVISFAGGLPAPELFPAADLARLFAQMLSEPGALQYSPTEGEPVLREVLAAHLSTRGTPAQPEQILLTNSSQHGLDLVAKALLDPGDTVLVENPTYLGALTAFRPYRPRVVPLACDEEGPLPSVLTAALQAERPKLVYLMPTFQNPRGTTMGAQRRAAIIALCQAADVAVVEDDPYGDLRYRGEAQPGLRHYWDQVIYLGTQSKTVAPGLRLGWVVAPPALMPALKIGLQATCLNVGALIQRVVARFISEPGYPVHLGRIRSVYHQRMRQMVDGLRQHFPAGTRWQEPEGGLFIWVELPGGLRSVELLKRAVAEGVVFVPGQFFFAAGGGESSLRLNFSNATPEQIQHGMAGLGRAAAGLLESAPV